MWFLEVMSHLPAGSSKRGGRQRVAVPLEVGANSKTSAAQAASG